MGNGFKKCILIQHDDLLAIEMVRKLLLEDKINGIEIKSKDDAISYLKTCEKEGLRVVGFVTSDPEIRKVVREFGYKGEFFDFPTGQFRLEKFKEIIMNVWTGFKPKIL